MYRSRMKRRYSSVAFVVRYTAEVRSNCVLYSFWSLRAASSCLLGTYASPHHRALSMRNHPHRRVRAGPQMAWTNLVDRRALVPPARRSNAASSSSLEREEKLVCSLSVLLSPFFLSFGSLFRRRESHFYERVALKIMTLHGETQLAALRPFLRPIRPESRYVYVCGNVLTPGRSISLQYPPKIFLHYARAIRQPPRFLSAEMKLSPAFVGRTKSRRENG